MILFEVLLYASILIHVFSGELRLANTDRIEKSTDASAVGSTLLASSSGINVLSPSIKRRPPEDDPTQATSEEPRKDGDEISSLRRESSSGHSLTSQKTRIARVTNPAKLNISDALLNSDPFPIDDKHLRMLAKVISNYTGDHAWTSAVLITLLVIGFYGYMLWFWWIGMYHMKECPCGSRGFFFVATFDIRHWIRWVVRVVLILAGAAVLHLLCHGISALVAFCACLVFQFGKSIHSLCNLKTE